MHTASQVTSVVTKITVLFFMCIDQVRWIQLLCPIMQKITLFSVTPVVESYTKEENENGIFYSIATKMYQFFENDCNIECDLLGSTGTIITWMQEKEGVGGQISRR